MLLGANGCGKSTLLRVIASLLPPNKGSVHVDLPFGFVFQNPDHQVVLPTVSADVAFGLGRYNLTDQEVTAAVHHALGRVKLSSVADRPTSSLSGGQKQRVAIARALINNPIIIMGDEPTGNLDKKNSDMVFDIFQQLTVDLKQTLLIVTHDPDFANRTNRIVTMQDGRIV